jgi:hypothetical protein
MKNIVLILSLSSLGACSSGGLLGCFSCGFEEGQREGAAFWQGFAVQAARAPGWGAPAQSSSTPQVVCEPDGFGAIICK